MRVRSFKFFAIFRQFYAWQNKQTRLQIQRESFQFQTLRKEFT